LIFVASSFSKTVGVLMTNRRRSAPDVEEDIDLLRILQIEGPRFVGRPASDVSAPIKTEIGFLPVGHGRLDADFRIVSKLEVDGFVDGMYLTAVLPENA